MERVGLCAAEPERAPLSAALALSMDAEPDALGTGTLAAALPLAAGVAEKGSVGATVAFTLALCAAEALAPNAGEAV